MFFRDSFMCQRFTRNTSNFDFEHFKCVASKKPDVFYL
ncbi:hypothetical protein BFV93_4101 [Alteromonas macleodii]|nr:hypothetical protein BFV93_4101 [Alteromonas macleodii]